MEQRVLYVIIAILTALVAALTGSLVAIVEGRSPTVVFRMGVAAFAGALGLTIVVMASLGVVES